MLILQGMHVLPSIHGAHVLIQIAVPGLEERVRFAAPLRSIPVSPGALVSYKGCARLLTLFILHAMVVSCIGSLTILQWSVVPL